MLFVLSGDIQIGKSRWLKRLVEDLTSSGVTCYGVIAPGVWIKSSEEKANAQGFEKLGIDNVLLPDGKRIRFADRVDLALEAGSYDGESQAAKAGLGWHISEKAMQEVNEHLAKVRATLQAHCGDEKCLLVVDELGRLELQHNSGLVEATRLLEEGPQGRMADALIVVRDSFATLAKERFSQIWGNSMVIRPDQEAKSILMNRFK